MTPDQFPDGLSREDRLQCLLDELCFGASFVVDGPDGPERLAPTEVTATEVTVSHE